MKKIVIDCTTGVQRIVPMTEAEILQRRQEQEAARERRQLEYAAERARNKAREIYAQFKGRSYASLTAAETRMLLGAVLYKLGVLDEQGNIK